MKHMRRFIAIIVCMSFVVVGFTQKPNGFYLLAIGGTITIFLW